MDCSRRSLLEALAGTAATAGLAGCGFLGSDGDASTSPATSTAPQTTPSSDTSTTPPGTSPGETATPEPTSTAPPPADDGVTGYPRWLASPDLFDQSHYHFVALRPARVLEHRDAYAGTETLAQIESDGTPGLTMAESDGIYLLNKRLTSGESLNFAQIINGGIERGPVVDLLADGFDLHEQGEYGGFTLFSRENLHGAVSDDDFVLFQSAGGVPALKRLVETSRGTAPRYHAENPALGTVVESLGIERGVLYGRGNGAGGYFPGGVARGAGWRTSNGSLEFAATVVFDSEDAADAGPVRTWAEEASPIAGAEAVAVESAGRSVSASATVDPGAVSALQPNWDAEGE